ncbi:MAG: BMP family ABC transporter substrate-binding protein [Spirochaetales bacterium]|nr:BMP family ABC transporter substrate-binding protein [Spirochaetales bacterium]
MHRRIWAAIALSVTVTILNACSPGARFLLYIDPYQLELLKAQGIDRRALAQPFAKDLRGRVVIPPLLSEAEEALAHFEVVAERARPDWVYLSAAHPFDPNAVSANYPDIRFFLEIPPGEARSNQISVTYDREQASFDAGEAIAALLQDPGFLQSIGAEEAGTQPPRVGILVAVTDQNIEAQIAAFREGFSRRGDAQSIVRKDIGNITDRVKARRLLEMMKEEAVAIVLLKTYVLSGFCLEYLAKEGGLAVVEEPISPRAYGDTVLLVLEDDFLAALGRMAGYAAANIERETSGREAQPVEGPVLLRWNESYRSLVTSVLEGEGVNRP